MGGVLPQSFHGVEQRGVPVPGVDQFSFGDDHGGVRRIEVKRDRGEKSAHAGRPLAFGLLWR